MMRPRNQNFSDDSVRPSTSSNLQTRWVQLSLLLMAAILLMARLDSLSFSVDEYVNVLIERGSWAEMIDHLRNGADLHPPVTHFLMNLWMQIVGESEWTIRYLWSAAGILNIALTFRLGAMLYGRRVGGLAALLLLSAPTYLLYMRFEKYYAFTITLSLAMLLAAYALWVRQTRWRIGSYGLTLVALLYTDYLAPLFLTLSVNLIVLIDGRQRQRIAAFLGTQVVAALLYIPWLTIMVTQASTLYRSGQADLGSSWLGTLIALGYWPYAIAVGETLLPWHFAAILSSLSVLVLGVMGLRACLQDMQKPDPCRPGSVLFLMILLSLAGSVWLTNWVFDSVPFIAFPNHSLFLAPLLMILLALGAARLSRSWVLLLFCGLLAGRIIGIHNYFTATDFHNPIYAVPMREIVTGLMQSATENEALVAAPDVGAHYYYDRLVKAEAPTALTHISLGDFVQATHAVLRLDPQRVWLFKFGRDRTAGATGEEQMADWLAANGYTLHGETGYVEQDSVYRKIKTVIFQRPAYPYKLLVQEFRRHQP